MKNISILVPETAVVEAVADQHKPKIHSLDHLPVQERRGSSLAMRWRIFTRLDGFTEW